MQQRNVIVLYILGAIGLIGAIYFVATAHAAKPVEVDGTLQHFYIHTSNGSYSYTEVILNEQPNTSYTFNENDFTPKVPESAYKDGKVNLWVDQGTTHVLAITLYDENDQNPIKYASAYYTNPQQLATDNYRSGGIAAVVGLALLGLGYLLQRRIAAQKAKRAVPANVPPYPPVAPTR
jgi:hypothetical protein